MHTCVCSSLEPSYDGYLNVSLGFLAREARKATRYTISVYCPNKSQGLGPLVNKGILRWASGGPFSKSRENSPTDLDYSGPPKKRKEKISTFGLFIIIIQT